jgi:putative redox protein
MIDAKQIAEAIASNDGGIYTTSVQAGSFSLIADEPEGSGGKGLGPNPGEYLCMALASCKVITLRMYAGRKNWKVNNIRVKVVHTKGDDDPTENVFLCELILMGDLTEEQQQRMLEISKKCPVDRLLGKTSSIVTVLS